MKRRDFIKSAALMAGASIASTSFAVDAISSGTKKYPNVIYILADDAGYGDFSCFGQKKFSTPNIDSLAKDGMKFTDHYAGCTVCAPSRCSLMTGLHTGHCFTRGNKGLDGYDYPIPADTFTAGDLFKKHGYKTACIGKWGLGGPNTTGHPNKQGFDKFYGYLSQYKAHFYYPDFLWDNETKVELSGKHYSHDLIQKEAINFISENSKKPFFLYLPYTIPHAELLIPENYMKEFDGKFPQGIPYVEKKGGKGRDYGSQEKPRVAFAAMMKRLDDSVGEILKTLKAKGIDNNTLVIFSSDNGPHHEGGADPEFFDSNGPLRGIKRDLYEGGIRMSLLAKWPGWIAPNSESCHISAFWDMLPTFAEILDDKTIPNVDGISMLPTMTGKGNQKEHKFLYWEFQEQGGKQAVRMGKWKGIRLNVRKNPDSPIELYDLSQDIGEKTNLAKEYPTVVKVIEKIMKREHKESKVYPLIKERPVQIK